MERKKLKKMKSLLRFNEKELTVELTISAELRDVKNFKELVDNMSGVIKDIDMLNSSGYFNIGLKDIRILDTNNISYFKKCKFLSKKDYDMFFDEYKDVFVIR